MTIHKSLIEILNLSHVYLSTKKRPSRKALDNVSLSIQKGETVGLLGPNGGGKTTLFRILSTALVPTLGEVNIFGQNLKKDVQSVRFRMGVVFQSPSLDKKLTLYENLVHQGHLYGLYGKTLKSRIHEKLEQMGLLDRSNDLVEHLSGGLARRGEIAKSLLHKPDLLIMDEPSTGLDPGARLELWKCFSLLKENGVTILITTHLMEEADKCDRLGILHEGRLLDMGTPVSLKEKIGGDVVLVVSKKPDELLGMIKKEYKLQPKLVDGIIRIEQEKGHSFIPQLVESFPGYIESVSVGKPTLEDVFVHKTGHRFWGETK